MFNMTEVHAGESCISIDSTTMSNTPSQDEVMSNGSHTIPKSITFGQNTVSISESVIAKKNLHTAMKEKVYSKQVKKWSNLESSYLPVALIILMFLIAAVLQIPTILYYTEPPSADTASLFDDINLESCTVNNIEHYQTSFNTPLITLCNESTLCSGHSETDEYHELEILQPVYSLSTLLGNTQCGEATLQFFFTAINETNNDNYTLKTDCLRIRDDICAAEWRIVEVFFNTSLPDCSSFDEDANFATARAPTLSCPDDFGVFCGSLCQPLCDEISIFNDTATSVYEVLIIIFHTLSLIAGIVTLLACLLRKWKMFSFPLIFVVYNTITFEIISLFLLLPYIFGSNDLLCSHPNLIVSTTEATPFCQMQGLVIQSGALIFFGFWLFHILHLLYTLMYPFKAQNLMKSPQLRRNIHILEVTVTLICGLLPSVIVIGTSGYKHFAFPPVCTNEVPEMLFYTYIFPMSIGATVGLCMLLICFIILRKNHHSRKAQILRKRPSLREMIFTSYSIPETKLIILFSYYGTAIILLLIYLVVMLRTNDTVVENVFSFTLCSVGGYRAECDKYRENLNNELTPAIVFDLISIVFLSLVNIINLLYVVQYKDIKEAFKKVFTSESSPSVGP